MVSSSIESENPFAMVGAQVEEAPKSPVKRGRKKKWDAEDEYDVQGKRSLVP